MHGTLCSLPKIIKQYQSLKFPLPEGEQVLKLSKIPYHDMCVGRLNDFTLMYVQEKQS